MSESSAPEKPDLTALNKRLGGALAELESQRRSVMRSAIISTCIGVILLGLLIGYFTVGYTTIADYAGSPDEFVTFVEGEANAQLIQLRREAETRIKEDSPEWAEMASEKLIESAPTIREHLEGLIFDQTKLLVDQLSVFTAQEFKKFLIEQRPMLGATIQELSAREDPTEQTMKELTAALEKEIGLNMQEGADSLLQTVYALNEKLEKLSDGRGLNLEESYLRRAMMILRRVQLEQQDPNFVGKKWTIATKVDANSLEEAPDETEAPEPDEKPEAEAPAPEAKEEAEPKAEAPAPEAKEEAEPKAETPAPEAKEEAKPKAEPPAPVAKEEAEPKEEAPAPEAKEEAESKAEADVPKPKSE